MNGKTLILSAMAATLMLGTAAQAFARNDDRGPGFGGRQGMFVHMLQEADADKNGQISKDEAKGAADKLFTAVDADNNGALTPGEMRKHREAKIDEWRKQAEADAKANPPQPGNGPQDGQGAGMGNGMGNGPGMGNGMGPGDGAGPMAGDRPRDGRHHGGPDGDGPRHGWGGKHDGKHMRDGDDRGPDGPMGGRMMRQADADENGQISKDEAQAMVEKAFTRMDRNADGAISADDFPKRPMWFR